MSSNSIVLRLGEKDRTNISVRRGDRVTELDVLSTDNLISFGIGPALEFLADNGFEPTEAAIDLVMLAVVLTAADTRIPRRTHSDDCWTRVIELNVPVADPAKWTANAPLIASMLQFLTGDMWTLKFRSRPKSLRKLAIPATGFRTINPDCVCLFSGGLDSFIGAVDLLSQGKLPIFVSHYWDGSTSSHQNACFANLQKEYGAHLLRVRAHVGFSADLIEANSTENTLRGRSFLFFALAMLVASTFKKAVEVFVPENGFISLNVPLDELRLGALSTRTTHPYYMARWNELLAALGVKATLTNPYRFQTKGEMVARCRNKPFLRRNAAATMSCSHPDSGRFIGESPGHCGRCVPCLIRRGALLAGIGRDDTEYRLRNLRGSPLDSEDAHGEHVRSFQLAIARLAKKPRLARALVLQPGPLSDYSESKVEKFARVYSAGLEEVDRVVRGVDCRPI